MQASIYSYGCHFIFELSPNQSTWWKIPFLLLSNKYYKGLAIMVLLVLCIHNFIKTLLGFCFILWPKFAHETTIRNPHPNGNLQDPGFSQPHCIPKGRVPSEADILALQCITVYLWCLFPHHGASTHFNSPTLCTIIIDSSYYTCIYMPHSIGTFGIHFTLGGFECC